MRSLWLARNVRRLENCIKRAVIMAEGQQITRADLGLDMAADDGDGYIDLRHVRDAAERGAVVTALGRATATSCVPPG
jgi:two-component system NtrC family response regulator